MGQPSHRASPNPRFGERRAARKVAEYSGQRLLAPLERGELGAQGRGPPLALCLLPFCIAERTCGVLDRVVDFTDSRLANRWECGLLSAGATPLVSGDRGDQGGVRGGEGSTALARITRSGA